VRRIHPGPEADLSDDDLWTAYAYPSRRPWVRATMVSTLDGTMRGPDGSSRSISTPTDQRVFGLARREADVILVGAGTIRAEDYRPSVRTVAIVTRRLDLPLTLRMFSERTAEHARPIAFTTTVSAASAPSALRDVIDIVGCGDDTVELPRVIADLKDRGLGRILCEGGPALLGELIAAGLLDELLLTLVPSLLGGGPREHILDLAGGLDPAVRLRPRLVLEDEGTVLLQLGRP
jgi:riboflavin biosynthesis pyrimidine reductase